MPSAAPTLKLTIAQRLLYAGTLVIVLLGGGAFAFASWSDYRDTLSMMETQARHIARVVEEHARGIVQASQAVVQHAAEFGLGGAPGDPEFRRWLELVSLSHSLPEKGALWTVDERGFLALDSGQYPAPELRLDGQRYFQEHLSGRTSVVGEAIQGMLTGAAYMTVSQRLTGPGGRFQGAVVAGIELGYFSAFYETLQARQGTSLAIYRTDGRVLVRHPPLHPADIGRDYAHLPLFEKLRDATQGHYRDRSPIDGVDRHYHYIAIPNSQLVTVAGLSVDAALAPWRQRMFRNAIGAILASAGLLALALFGYRALRREERNQAALAEAHEQLHLAMSRLERARAEADHANLAKTRFLAAASHDLRQPLQAVSLFVDVLLNILREPKALEVAGKAREALDSSRSLLDSLLNLSVLEAGTLAAETRDIPVARVIEPLAQEFAPQFERSGLVFRYVPSSTHIRTDPVLLQRILRNMLINALRYTESGKVLLGCRRIGGTDIRIEVWDTGPGIAPDKLPRIFEEFYQLDVPSREAAKGLGLGLAIVAKTARLLEHRVGVRSVPGLGTGFAVVAPRTCGLTPDGSASPAPPSRAPRPRSDWHWS